MSRGLWIGIAWLAGFLFCCGLLAFDGTRSRRKGWEKEIIEGLLVVAAIWPLLLVIYAGEALGNRFRKSGTTTQPPSPASTNQRPGE